MATESLSHLGGQFVLMTAADEGLQKPVTYAWVQDSGAAVALVYTDRRQTSFVAPHLNADTDLVFTVTATGADDATMTNTITVSVEASVFGDTDDIARLNRFSLQGRTPVYTLRINHPDLNDDVYLVNDSEDITVNGQTYIALAFRERLPADNEQEVRRASIEIDNIGRPILDYVEQSRGGAGSTVVISEVVLRPGSRDAERVWAFPALSVGAARITGSVIRIELTDETASRAPAVKVRHSPVESPGLF